MARIYKVTAYIVDVNEVYHSGEEWLEDALNATDDVFCPCHAEIKEAEVEWNDDLPINSVDCKIEDCENYFTKK